MEENLHQAPSIKEAIQMEVTIGKKGLEQSWQATFPPDGEGYWLHDACAVAVYFCKKCLNTTALYNQG